MKKLKMKNESHISARINDVLARPLSLPAASATIRGALLFNAVSQCFACYFRHCSYLIAIKQLLLRRSEQQNNLVRPKLHNGSKLDTK